MGPLRVESQFIPHFQWEKHPKIGLERSKSRTSRLGIEDPMETCTKYCSSVSSAGDVGFLDRISRVNASRVLSIVA
ncbi:UNVERIFIED_CONTAM: hypothetical protein Sangu_2641200 [Sesamum angustifolium]|uniref:Uncharacterized protein n=1 Tax=Sesamum angustifolium TaxID=2727405 RepID=A0AAW2J341_9LAMI